MPVCFRRSNGAARERGADREHLALAAGQVTRLARAQLCERRKERVDRFDEPARVGTAARNHGLEVLCDGEVLEHLAALGDERNAKSRHPVRRMVIDAFAAVDDRALRDACIVQPDEARNRAQRGGLARSVGSEQSDDRALRH